MGLGLGVGGEGCRGRGVCCGRYGGYLCMYTFFFPVYSRSFSGFGRIFLALGFLLYSLFISIVISIVIVFF